MYTTNCSWVCAHVEDKELIARYAHGRSFYNNPNSGEKGPFKVKVIYDGDAYIQRDSILDKSCYLVNVEGLEKIL